MKKKLVISFQIRDENVIGTGKTAKLHSSGIEYNFDGYWMGNTSNWHIGHEERKEIGIDFKPTETFTIQDKTLYRFPKLDLPRQKVDLLKEKYNCKVIRDPQKADVHIVSEKFFNDLFDCEWNKCVPFKLFFEFLTDIKNASLLSDAALDKAREMVNSLDKDLMVRVNIPYNYNQGAKTQDITDSFKSFVDVMYEKHNVTVPGSRDIVLHESDAPTYQGILDALSTKTILYDTAITAIIDEELATIENSEYNNVEAMVKSNDRQNRSLALEMLANCNLEKSFDVVSSIYYWNYDWLKDTDNWNSVNVKAMRRRLEKYSNCGNQTSIWPYNNFIKSLIDDNKLTKFALDHTRERLMRVVLDSLIGKTAEVFAINLSDLRLKDNLLNNLIIEKNEQAKTEGLETDDITDNLIV